LADGVGLEPSLPDDRVSPNTGVTQPDPGKEFRCVGATNVEVDRRHRVGPPWPTIRWIERRQATVR